MYHVQTLLPALLLLGCIPWTSAGSACKDDNDCPGELRCKDDPSPNLGKCCGGCCGNRCNSGTASATSGDSNGSGTSTSETSVGSVTVTTTSPSTGTTTGGICGDGTVDADEQCDDGKNDGSYGGCKPNCELGPRCGDGEIQLDDGEVCDDGKNDGSYNGCRNDCTEFGPHCGDGVTQSSDREECDDGNQNNDDQCTTLCMPPACGDGFLQAGEECDAGRQNGPGKACNGECVLNVCGDGDKGPDEACDDGNADNTDECTNTCQSALCGDGYTWVGMEECDDGNDIDDWNCLGNCTIPMRAFVSSGAFKGDFKVGNFEDMSSCPEKPSALDRADCICADAAKAAGLENSGSYSAWLSTSSQDAKSRISQPSRKIYRTGDQQLVAINTNNLVSGSIFSAISHDEYGEQVNLNFSVWTGTLSNGTKISPRCMDWDDPSIGTSGVYGNCTAILFDWTFDGASSCQNDFRLYCFGGPPP